MRKVYWVATAIGISLTPYAHKMATTQRGYTAIGGELFITPLLLMMAVLIDQLWEMVQVIKNMDLENEKANRR